jgi:hypothetical protein
VPLVVPEFSGAWCPNYGTEELRNRMQYSGTSEPRNVGTY